jgi:heme exporter protein B
MHTVRIVWAVFSKDLRVEWRDRETLASMCVFSILIVFLFNFAFEPGREESLRMLPGLLWIAFFFAGILGFNRSFAAERENACLEGMTLAPVDAGAIYLGKLLSNLFFLAVTEFVVVFAVTLWYNFSFLPSLERFALIAFLGTLGYAALGTIFGAISANTRMREVMLPVLQFPAAFPLFIGAIEATSGALRGDPPGDYSGALQLLAGASVIYVVLSYLLFEYVLEE